MDVKQEELYIGIDLGDDWTQISYYRPGMKEPETISVVAGEERYRIPTTPYKERISKGQTQEAQEMLQHFLRKVMRYPPELTDFDQIRAVTIHLKELELKNINLLKSVMEQLGISKDRVFVQDSRESFCHFVMNQEKELMQHDAVLFFAAENELAAYWLTREAKTQPQKVKIQTLNLGILPLPAEERDRSFAEKAEAALHGKIVSAVYLMGDGLEGGWLKESLHVLCRGRKAFQGKNLFTKGACYNSVMQMHKDTWKYVYFSEYVLTQNIFIQVKNGNKTFFRELAGAGTSCFDVNSSCQVLLEGSPSVDIWVQPPDSKEAKIVSLQLPGLPERPPKATRLLVEALPGEKGQVTIRIEDMGFGAWYEASGRKWEFII